MAKIDILSVDPDWFDVGGGVLCDLLGAGNGTTPDFLIGGGKQFGHPERGFIMWYHWDGTAWRETEISRDFRHQVGAAAMDVTGSGKLDLVFGEWTNEWEGEWTKVTGRPGGNIYWAEQPADPFTEPWVIHFLGDGCLNAHDISVGDVSGSGRQEVIVRNKDRAIFRFTPPEDPTQPWYRQVVAEQQEGDGLDLYDITGTGSLDIVTNTGFYENVAGDGSEWRFRPYGVEDLGFDPESRVAAGDLTNDGAVTVVVTESEVTSSARILLLTSRDRGATWTRNMLIGAERDFRALHTLRLLDLNGDGRLDIFTAEMENGKTDGIARQPRWYAFLNKGELTFDEVVLLDRNLGAHQGCVGPIFRQGQPAFMAKEWHPNASNGKDGRNHVVTISDFDWSRDRSIRQLKGK
ncbi:hypothetical protein GZH47_24155 [Paenibacillus rhizovicinus]|uniref:VCBS repeat-containing protein n=1 Tax=Paenibacillus rhizovicinus TaxID=2704463 RepID=A0A6C0P7G2_9BACL|nr:hypothetical protein [Paenibacillus rhizovicinus]QHW33583.1 hypothetical protein GZH47_24155 [Paenibacillus rhizovicinus]